MAPFEIPHRFVCVFAGEATPHVQHFTDCGAVSCQVGNGKGPAV